MCCIAVAVDRKPTFDEVNKMYEDNSHGASISWFNEKGLAQYRKGLDEDELFKMVYDTPLPFVLHFRKSSFWKDNENKLLNHPFEVIENSPLRLEGEAQKLLIHNGTIKEYELMLAVADISVEKDEPMTDTRAIAMIMAKNNNEKLPFRLPGKYVVLDSIRKRFRLAGDFSNENGLLCSNTSWKYGTKNYVSMFGGCSDDEYYQYLMGGDMGVVNHSETDATSESDDKKKTTFKTAEAGFKKKTQKIKTKAREGTKTSDGFKPLINNEMSEHQYNSGIYYNSNNGDKYAQAGLKERRLWWKFYYNPSLYYQQKDIRQLGVPTTFQCKQCKGFLTYARVNTLNILGTKVNDFMCLTCERLSKNTQSRMEPIHKDTFQAKTTRMLSMPPFACC